MSPNAKLWTAAITAGVLGVLIGGGAIWAMQKRNVAPATTESAQLSALQEQLDRKDGLIAGLTEQLASLASTSPATPTETPSAPSGTDTTKQFTFVRQVTTAGGMVTVAADFAQFLTGKAAADAATARGDESPPPNDYYIVNDNKKLRKLPVKVGISVKLTARTDGTSEPEGYTVPLATWAGYFVTPTEDDRGITDGPYWFTITDGAVTAIEEQYTP